MDEVPVVNANPVNTIIKKTEKAQKQQKSNQIVVSLKNLVYMFPLAFIVLLQMFFLGRTFGNFTTLPYTCFSTFVFVASIAVLLFLLQLMQRSIVYSTLGGVVLLSGIYFAWFGDFHTTIFANLQNVGTIVKAAWTRKDIPFPLLMAGIMTFSIAGIAFLQFFVSLFVKSFFETIFGKDWGDGRWMGFVGAIALLLGVQLSFFFYFRSVSNTENRLLWSLPEKYRPVEKYLTTTPGTIMLSKERIFSSHNQMVKAISLTDGKVVAEKQLRSAVIRDDWQQTETPVFFTDKEMICFNNQMNVELWRVAHPATFTELVVSEDFSGEIDYLPQTAFFTDSGNRLLVYYNYGFIGYYNVKDGSCMWLKSLDRQAPIRRLFSDDFPHQELFHETGEMIIFSLQNGIIKAISKNDGSQIWQYQHENPKHNGKPQKGLLTGHKERILAAFKTGELVALSLENGKVIYRGRNDSFSFKTAPSFDGLQAGFLTDEGFFHIVEVDGARSVYSCNLLPKKLDFLPFVVDTKQNIFAHMGEVIKIDNQQVKIMLRAEKKVFVTKPVYDDKLMYIGTQDGWIFCIHTGSFHEKWSIHVGGELEHNSLQISGSRLLVKTRSGSISAIDRRF